MLMFCCLNYNKMYNYDKMLNDKKIYNYIGMYNCNKQICDEDKLYTALLKLLSDDDKSESKSQPDNDRPNNVKSESKLLSDDNCFANKSTQTSNQNISNKSTQTLNQNISNESFDLEKKYYELCFGNNDNELEQNSQLKKNFLEQQKFKNLTYDYSYDELYDFVVFDGDSANLPTDDDTITDTGTHIDINTHTHTHSHTHSHTHTHTHINKFKLTLDVKEKYNQVKNTYLENCENMKTILDDASEQEQLIKTEYLFLKELIDNSFDDDYDDFQ